MSLLKKLGEDFASGTNEFPPARTEDPVLDEVQDSASQDVAPRDPSKPYFEGDDIITDPELVGPPDSNPETKK